MTTVLSEDTTRSADPASWDRLAGGHFYSSSGWLSFTNSEPGAISGAVTGWEGDELVAAVPVAKLTAPPMPFYRWNDLLSSYGLPLLPANGVLVGPRQGYQTHFLVAESNRGTAVMADLVERIRRLPADSDSARVAMYVTTEDALAIREAGVDAPPVFLDADAWFPVHPDGWQAWLDAQPRNRKVKARKEARRFREAGYQITHLPLADCYERLAVAAASTQSKYGHTGDPEHYRQSLRRYSEEMGESARVSICTRESDDPVGFCVYFHWGDTLFLRWCGFDYSRLCGVAEYFNLLYYDQLQRAAQLGVRWIHAGIKSVEAKARRGARLRPLWMVDLTPGSVLTEAVDRIREHNARGYQSLADDSQTSAALVDQEPWSVFR
jgi:predicted N-acyltransferase